MPVWVGDRRVFVKDGTHSQTVNVCDVSNYHGNYEAIYRIRGRDHFITETAVGGCRSLDALRDLLLTRHQASPEGGRSTCAAPAPAWGVADAPLRAIEPVLTKERQFALMPEDPWLDQARAVVEHAIDRFVQQFLSLPYFHRVEHSLHVQLASLLMAEPILAGCYPIGQEGTGASLVQKEYPESRPRPEKGNRRGNFDLAVLSPRQLRQCCGITDFLEGRPTAPIAIEIGLDYDYGHLAGDHRKLLNSEVPLGYLIHLSREQFADPRTEQLVLEPPQGTGIIRTAYARTQGSRIVYKLVNETQLQEGRRPPICKHLEPRMD